MEYIGEEQVLSGTYKVKSGDSLWSIAKKYGITVDELKAYNNLSSNLLRVGQTLKIPEYNQEEIISPTDYIVYTVKSGDNLYSIGRKYNISPTELMNYNNLSTNLLSIGQKIRIPKSSETEEITPSTDYIVYIVKSGDNLYSIGRKYNISPTELMNYNNLSTNLLSIGQEIRIPQNNNGGINYVVKKGDNLYSIARKYNTTVSEIKNKNNLTSNNLSIGQILKI